MLSGNLFLCVSFVDKPTLKPFQQLFHDKEMAPNEAIVASNAFVIKFTILWLNYFLNVVASRLKSILNIVQEDFF